MRPQLRVFLGEEASEHLAEPDVAITFGELTNVLSDAICMDRTWLQDFADDNVRVSADLYEVLTLARQLKSSA